MINTIQRLFPSKKYKAMFIFLCIGGILMSWPIVISVCYEGLHQYTEITTASIVILIVAIFMSLASPHSLICTLIALKRQITGEKNNA